MRSLIESGLIRPTVRRIDRNTNLYVCGESGSTIFFISRGWVKRVVPDRAGRPTIVDMNHEGDVVGETSLTDGLRHDSAFAKSDCIVQVIPHDAFIEAVRSQDLVAQWTAFLCQRLLEQQEVITQFVAMDSERRLAARLLMLSTRGSLQRMTHEELAAMIGTTRSRVGVFLQRFEDIGLINRTPGRIVVLAGPMRRYLAGATSQW